MNPVVHFEMPYRDGGRATRFYQSAFGWEVTIYPAEAGDYLFVTTAKEDACKTEPRGAVQGGLYPFKADWPMQYPSIVIAVDDIKTAMERVEKAGGRVLGEPMTIAGVGEYVSFVDTEGNRNSILQPNGDKENCR